MNGSHTVGRINDLRGSSIGPDHDMVALTGVPKGASLNPAANPEIPQEVNMFRNLTDELHEEISILTECLGSVLTGPTDKPDGGSTNTPPVRCSALAQNLSVTNERLAIAITRVRNLRINISAAI